MNPVANIARAVVGVVFIFVVHIPRLVYNALLCSYYAAFGKQENLTADPAVHIQRAKRLLKKDNSHLLYAALEIRLALERMTDREVEFASNASKSVLKKNDPSKKVNYLRELDVATNHPHKIMMRSKQTSDMMEIGQYKPLVQKRVKEIDGRMGNLLHLMHGIPYGMPNDPWYNETRQYLNECAEYLSGILKESTPFFTFENLDHIEMVRIEKQEEEQSVPLTSDYPDHSD